LVKRYFEAYVKTGALMELAMVLIGIISLAVTIWVLIETKKSRENSETQISLSVEPKFELYVTVANENTISLDCRNKGAMVDDVQLFTNEQSLGILYFCFEQKLQAFQAFLDFPKLLLQGKEKTQLRIEYKDKLNRKISINYIYSVSDKIIIPM
jgi:hypothetical protein